MSKPMRRVAALFAGTWLAIGPAQLPAHGSPQPQQSGGGLTLEDRPTGPPVIRATAALVLVDVVVTDSKDRRVTGLRQQDFRVLENGEEQKIASFEVHMDTPPAGNASAAPAKLPLNTFANYSTAPANGPLNVIVFDTLNTPLDDQLYAHQELLKFIKTKPAGSQMSILVLSNRLHVLQSFTDNEELLLAAVNNKEAWPHSQGPPFMAAQLTMDAFTGIARYLTGVPGRKNLIWLSAGFPFVSPLNEFIGRPLVSDQVGDFVPRNVAGNSSLVQPIMHSMDPLPDMSPINPLSVQSQGGEPRKVADLLVAAQVALYTIDVRGLASGSHYSAQEGPSLDPDRFNIAQPFTGSTPPIPRRSEQDSLWTSKPSDFSSDYLAERSGGRAFKNRNDLHVAITLAVEHGSNYYTLSYTPANPRQDGSLRKIDVRLTDKEKSYHLAYRRSYFADDRALVMAEVASPPADPLEASVQFGVPSLHALVFQIHAARVGSPTLAKPDQIALLSKFADFAGLKLSKKERLQRCSLDFTVPLKQFNSPALPNGAHRASLEIAAVAYDADGNKLNGTHAGVRAVIPTRKNQALQDDGYRIHQEIDVPVEAKTLRIAVRDSQTNRIGTLAIPLPLS